MPRARCAFAFLADDFLNFHDRLLLLAALSNATADVKHTQSPRRSRSQAASEPAVQLLIARFR